MAHTSKELVAERVRLLGSGNQIREVVIRHTKRPLDDPEDLREATNKGDMDIWGVAQDIVQGEARQAGLRGMVTCSELHKNRFCGVSVVLVRGWGATRIAIGIAT